MDTVSISHYLYQATTSKIAQLFVNMHVIQKLTSQYSQLTFWMSYYALLITPGKQILNCSTLVPANNQASK